MKYGLPQNRIAFALRHVFAAALLATLGGCSESILDPAGVIGEGERVILLNAVAIMLAIVIPTMLAILAIAWWFRASNTRARHLPDWEYSGRLELLVWSVPALAILFLGGIAWISSHDLDPAHPIESSVKPLEVQVVSLDWKWLFIYPQQNVASINRLVVPVGVPLHLRLTSSSVFNVFFVPRLGSEIYTMYGMATQLYLEADKAGTYPGLSAHFSGDGFSGMAFNLESVSPAQFAGWAAQARAQGQALDDGEYRSLLRQSQDVKPYTYLSVRPGLFEDIVMQKLPPGEGYPVSAPSPKGEK